jgi:hypothetical protein
MSSLAELKDGFSLIVKGTSNRAFFIYKHIELYLHTNKSEQI